MAEYVNRDEVLEILSERTAPWNGYQKVRDMPSADVVERTLFDERMAEYQEALDKANEKLAYITGTDDYHYDLEYGREQLNSYVSALVYEKTKGWKKGEWLHKEITDDFHVVGQCSFCKERRRIDNFCPNCGADMREPDGKEARRIKKQLALNGLGYPYDLPNIEV